MSWPNLLWILSKARTRSRVGSARVQSSFRRPAGAPRPTAHSQVPCKEWPGAITKHSDAPGLGGRAGGRHGHRCSQRTRVTSLAQVRGCLLSAPKTPVASRGRLFWGLPLTCGGWAVPHSLPIFLHTFLEVGELQGLGDELLRIAVNNRIPAGRKASQATGPGAASSRHPSGCLELTYGRDPQKVLHIKSEGQVPETSGGPVLLPSGRFLLSLGGGGGAPGKMGKA